MPVTQLKRVTLPKPWGRSALPPPFDRIGAGEERIGEILHECDRPERLDLLVKHIFTSERLSIQVHPDDDQARPLGFPSGKDEAWVVLAAEPDATIGIGLTRSVSTAELRAAALDGGIEALVDWRPVAPGDVFHLPAGTVHAIGPGLVIAEIQQNVDVTFRLYDYGRPRELHLDAALASARIEPHLPLGAPEPAGPGRDILLAGPKFVIERWQSAAGTIGSDGEALWLVPLEGECAAGNVLLEPGHVWLGEGAVDLAVGSDARLLVAYAGAAVRPVQPARPA